VASTYIVFGLTIHSNLVIPGLSPVEDSGKTADVQIHLGEPPASQKHVRARMEELTYTSLYADESGNPGLRIWKTPDGGLLRLEYYDGIQFWLERNGNSLWAVWPTAATVEDAASYLLGPVFGLLLRLRGVTCLHASAVSIEDQCIAFVGAEGAGKSTAAAAFARLGFGVVSDDVTALDESPKGFHVLPAYPHVCLWQDSVEMLYGSREALPCFSTGWEKRRLALGDHGTRFENRALPLRAVYLLGERRAFDAPLAEPLRPQAGLLSLVADTFANKVLDREMRAKEFAVLGRLAMAIPIRLLHPHSDSARLEKLCEVVLEDLAAQESPANA